MFNWHSRFLPRGGREPGLSGRSLLTISFKPCIHIFGLFHLHRLFCKLERMEGIDHHGKLKGFFLADAGFGHSGLGAVGEPERMQTDVTLPNAFAAHEVTLGVVYDLVRLNVGVIVRHGDAIRVIIKETWDKGTEHEVVALKSLVGGRGLMDPARDRLKVLNVEYPGIEISIPPDNIEGMMIQHMTGQAVAHFDSNLEFAALGMR